MMEALPCNAGWNIVPGSNKLRVKEPIPSAPVAGSLSSQLPLTVNISQSETSLSCNGIFVFTRTANSEAVLPATEGTKSIPLRSNISISSGRTPYFLRENSACAKASFCVFHTPLGGLYIASILRWSPHNWNVVMFSRITMLVVLVKSF